MSDAELISQIKEIIKDGRVRDTWRISQRATMVYSLNKSDLDKNTEIVEKLKELLD
jgi:hypothetical protein